MAFSTIQRKPPPGRECRHPLCGSVCKKKKLPKKKARVKNKVRPKRISDKRREIHKTYIPAKNAVIKENPRCKVKSPVCTRWAQGMHHLEGRVGKLLTDLKKQIPCCNACNGYIEEHPEWAKKNGFKKANYTSKLTNVKKI